MCAWQQVPDAQVIIVGTHVDHPALSRTTLEQIWQQLRQLLSEARDHHQRFFTHAECVPSCLLCQTDPHHPRRSDALPTAVVATAAAPDDDREDVAGSFVNHAFDSGDQSTRRGCTTQNALNGVSTPSDDDDDHDDDMLLSGARNNNNIDNDDKRTMTFPHIVGYYEVSCTARGHGIAYLRDAVIELATRLIGSNPEIPRRWSNVDRSLSSRAERSGSVCTLDQLKDIASVQAVSDPQDVVNMMHFFRAQGRILYFPQVSLVSARFLSV